MISSFAHNMTIYMMIRDSSWLISLESWKAYIGALKETLDGAALTQLKASILDRAEAVAKSAGGFLGLGNKVSDVERKVLDDLSNSFG